MTRAKANPVGARITSAGRPESVVLDERYRNRWARSWFEGFTQTPECVDVLSALAAHEAALDAELATSPKETP